MTNVQPVEKIREMMFTSVVTVDTSVAITNTAHMVGMVAVQSARHWVRKDKLSERSNEWSYGIYS